MIIQYTIDKSIRKSIPATTKAKDFLKAVEAKFTVLQKLEKSNYLILLTTITYDDVSCVRDHILTLWSYYNELKDMKKNFSKSFFVWQVIQSLPSQFSTLKTSSSTQKGEWSMDKMISIILQKEKMMKKGKVLVANVVTHGVNAKKRKFKGNNNYKAWGKKPKNDDKPILLSLPQNEPFEGKCQLCKMLGHKQRDCMKFKAWIEKKGIHFALMCFESKLIYAPSDTWSFDTGATTQVSKSYMNLEIRETSLLLWKFFESYKYSFVPSIRQNLLYISALDKQGYFFHFGNGKIILYNGSCLIGYGILVDGLYKVELNHYP